MSGTSVSRAAVFSQRSQDVEVCLDGSWWPGSILGWRHDEGGACEVWVRAMVAGASREEWLDLATLRLPSVDAPVAGTASSQESTEGASGAAGPGSAAFPATVILSRAAAREHVLDAALSSGPCATGATAGRRRRHAGVGTAELPAVTPGVEAGRHRAPAAGGRHRAADEESAAEGAAGAPGRAVAPSEIDCLTRPLRVGERTTRPRLPRPEVVARA